jgi:dipeptidyl aminopeptidase B
MGARRVNHAHEESIPPTNGASESSTSRNSTDTLSSDASSIVNNADSSTLLKKFEPGAEQEPYRDEEHAVLDDDFLHTSAIQKPGSKRLRWTIWILGLLCLGGWILAFVLFLSDRRHPDASTATIPMIYDPDSTTVPTQIAQNGKPLSLDDIMERRWSPRTHSVSWIAGPNGEDGLLLEEGASSEGYLRVEDVRGRKEGLEHSQTRVLMKSSSVSANGRFISPSKLWPSPDFQHVLIMADHQSNWRYSYTGTYWLFDVISQSAQPLDPADPDGRIQLASWSPKSDAVVFTRGNNMFLRILTSDEVIPITTDGGTDLFYGVPDWVYEEEVFYANSATWWSNDGRYIAFMETDESIVPEYPVQYFFSRPSGNTPSPGLENYPEIREIKYPKAGAPNPVVNLKFYDIDTQEVFSIPESQGFADHDRIVIQVIWASNGKVLVRETNRESDILKVVLLDMQTKTSRVARSDDIASLDGGWVETTHTIHYVPADPSAGRDYDGYIDTVIHNGYNHIGYFSPVDNDKPIYLTMGDWEVDDAPSAIDLKKGLVYFVATVEDPTQRHIYSVKLDGSDMRPVTNASQIGYYRVSFSAGSGYALLGYVGPSIPWQKIISTPSNDLTYEEVLEENKDLANMASEYALPINVYQAIEVDGFKLQVVERRPPHFNPNKKYPVLFYLYGGPGSQTVDCQFTIDFQSYLASALGYIVVSVDGRGTGFSGRKARCIVRGNLGYYEAHDQIAVAKIWGSKDYVDESRIAIWGWSFGGFMTLKTLEQDAGKTFQYGMAVAPVTDWRFYGKSGSLFPFSFSGDILDWTKEQSNVVLTHTL